ncbi:MAG: hypothetical protein JXA21_11145 [Anaerolineae bacterium]|nr:hypothetical protein [Anaerolineae bacterium]
MGSSSVDELLQQGIAAAKGGQQSQAKALLTQVLRQDARNAQAWLWLAGITHDPVEQETCLQRVLSIDPYNDVARQGLAKVSPRATQQMLKQGIAAVQSGDLVKGRALLEQVTDRDEKQASAWLWLSEVVGTQEEQVTCLENVLALEPGNMEVQARLLRLSSQSTPVLDDSATDANFFNDTSLDALLFGDPAPEAAPEALTDAISPGIPFGDSSMYEESPAYEEPPMYSDSPRYEDSPMYDSPSLNGGASTEDPSDLGMFGGYEIVDSETISAEPVAWDAVWAKYKEAYSCPYCAAPAEESRKSCPACGRSLMSATRIREHRSLVLWIYTVLQGLAVLGMIPALIFVFAFDPAEITSQLPPGTAQEIFPLFMQVSGIVRVVALGGFLVAIVEMVGLCARWEPIWYWFLIRMIFGALMAIISFVFSLIRTVSILGVAGLLPFLFGLAIAAGVFAFSFWLLSMMRDDFVVVRERILLGLDEGLASGEDYLDQGMVYAHEGKWALAAVHFHRAISIMGDDPEPYRVATIAGVRLHDATLARYALEQFKGRVPDNPRLADLTKLVEAIR